MAAAYNKYNVAVGPLEKAINVAIDTWKIALAQYQKKQREIVIEKEKILAMVVSIAQKYLH
jgi:hypothetical protein